MLIICEKMGWDYYTYINQPSWFIKGLNKKIYLDTYKHNLEIKKMKKYGNRQ